MKTKTKKKLPNKPSALIRVAVEDLKKAERDKKTYRINMDDWHVSEKADLNGSGKCEICFAGAVIAFSLGIASNETMNPDDFPKTTKQKLYALDQFRYGEINEALEYLGLENKPRLRLLGNDVVTDYEVDPKQFKQDMLEISDTLERLGA